MSFRKYEEYKESGIEWLEEVPKHWEVSLLKRRYQVTLGKMLKSNQTSPNETEEFYLRAANIHWRGVDTTDVKRMWFTAEEKKKLKLCKEDLLVSEGGDVGRSALWNEEIEECYIQNSINRIRAREDADTRFLFYWMYFVKHVDYIDMICNKATIAHFTVEKVEATPCVYPPLEEQKQIAAFLDKETTKIDTLTDKQEQLITLLQEKRQAIISHAVTRGLNPNVRMKDSGIEWLGEVPKHWEVSLLKRRYQVTLGKMLKSKQTVPDETEEPYLRAANIHWRGVDTTDVKRMWFTPEEKKKLKLCKWDLLVSEGGDVGRSSLWNEEIEDCYIQNSINRIRAREDADTRFLFFWMYFIKHADYIDMICNKATIAHFTVEKVEATLCVYPPLEEQRRIIAFLDKETTKINTLIEKCETAIELLKERRTALISAAVTGKIDVRNAV